MTFALYTFVFPCEPEELAGDLLTNVVLPVFVLKAKGHLNEMSKGQDGSLPQLYNVA